jgi:hypothetical protein
MNCKTMLAVAMGAAAMMDAAQAGTYHWSGAVDGCWTNAANWAENAVPGQYYDATGSKTGATGDIVYFDSATLTGAKATTINCDGLYSISNLYTTGSAKFTYGTTSPSPQYLSFEVGGTFSAAETATTPVATVACRLRLGVDCPARTGEYGKDMNYIVNNGTEEFVLNDWGYSTKAEEHGTGGEPHLVLRGSGPVRVAKTWAFSSNSPGHRRLTLEMAGTLTVDAPLLLRSLAVPVVSGITTPMNIVLTENGQLGPYYTYGFLDVRRDTVMSGSGAFIAGYSNRAGGTVDDNVVYGAHLKFLCPVKSVKKGDGDVAETYTRRMRFTGGSVENSSVTFAGGCDAKGTVSLASWSGTGALLKTDSFGKAGTFGGLGDVDFEISRGGLCHTGATLDEMDRAIAITNLDASTAGVVTLDQGGAGEWKVTSPVTLKAGSSVPELYLTGSGAGAATFAGSIPDNVIVRKTGTAVWTFAPTSTYVTRLRMDGGTVIIGADQTIGTLHGINYSTRLIIAAGKSVTINSLDFWTGRSVDIVLMDDAASVTMADTITAESLPSGLTVNGMKPTIDDSHKLVVDTSSGAFWKSATSGSWSEGGNWVGGAKPAAMEAASIIRTGDDYVVTLDGTTETSEVALTNLVVNNYGAGTATLLLTNNAELTVASNSGDANGKATTALKLGTGGAVNVADSTLRVRDFGSYATRANTYNSVVELDGGEISLSGASKFVLHGMDQADYVAAGNTTKVNLNSMFTFGTGKITLAGDSQMLNESAANPEGVAVGSHVFYHTLCPTRAGEVTEVTFKNSAYLASSSYQLDIVPNGGRATMTFDTDYASFMNAYNLFGIGVGKDNMKTGVGEFLVKKGKVTTGGWDYVYVGGTRADQTDGATGLCLTGRLEVAEGGYFQARIGQPMAWDFRCVQFGHATPLTNDRGSNFCHGELILNGGTFEQQRGSLFFGIGADGDADAFHNSGAMKVVLDPVKNPRTPESGKGENMNCAMVLGAFGGQGRYVMKGGTYESGIPVYVGGILTNDLNRWHVNGATFDKYHDAQGTLTIEGGTFATTNNVVLGRDGTGVLTLAGSGKLSANAIVVKGTDGAAASELRFVVGEDGLCGAIDAATQLKFEAAANVVVDVSAYAENPKKVVLWNLDNAPEGLGNVTCKIVGNEKVPYENAISVENEGRRAVWRVARGAVMIIR